MKSVRKNCDQKAIILQKRKQTELADFIMKSINLKKDDIFGAEKGYYFDVHLMLVCSKKYRVGNTSSDTFK